MISVQFWPCRLYIQLVVERFQSSNFWPRATWKLSWRHQLWSPWIWDSTMNITLSTYLIAPCRIKKTGNLFQILYRTIYCTVTNRAIYRHRISTEFQDSRRPVWHRCRCSRHSQAVPRAKSGGLRFISCAQGNCAISKMETNVEAHVSSTLPRITVLQFVRFVSFSCRGNRRGTLHRACRFRMPLSWTYSKLEIQFLCCVHAGAPSVQRRPAR